jgi:3-dehydroquinate synthase II
MNQRIPLWVDLSAVPENEQAAMQLAAADAGVDRIIEPSDDDVVHITIGGAADQISAAEVEGIVIIDGDDWTIIPLENIIAARRDRPGTLFAVARGAEEATRLRHVLDVGVHGIVLRPKQLEDIGQTLQALNESGARVDDTPEPNPIPVTLTTAAVGSIEQVENAERVCIDCTERFHDGEGLLIGSTASSMALVHAETIASEFVGARPFRVNAGAVHSYVLCPDDRTAYLSEMTAGKQVLAVAAGGAVRPMNVGRAKIEHRPSVRVSWHGVDGEGNAVVQFAETIRLVRPNLELVSVTDLEPGDEILVHAADSARHMGMPVAERLVEK